VVSINAKQNRRSNVAARRVRMAVIVPQIPVQEMAVRTRITYASVRPKTVGASH
jgi:hypothetical protein